MFEADLTESEIHIDITRLRYDFTEILSQVAMKGCRCIIDKSGKGYVCLIPLNDLIKLKSIESSKNLKTSKELVSETILSKDKLNIESMKLYNYNEATKILSISYRSLKKRIDLGEIKPIRLGSMVRFSGEEIKRFLKRQAAIYDIEGAAIRLGLSIYAIRKLIGLGKLKASKSHKKHLISESEIERFLNELIN